MVPFFLKVDFPFKMQWDSALSQPLELEKKDFEIRVKIWVP
jgi:hypothetical protein